MRFIPVFRIDFKEISRSRIRLMSLLSICSPRCDCTWQEYNNETLFSFKIDLHWIFLFSSHVLTILSSPDAICAPQVESFDLQVDYWLVPPKVDPSEKTDKTAKKDLKCSLKTMFRSMQIFRPLLPSSSMPLGGGSLPRGEGWGKVLLRLGCPWSS